MPGFYLGEKLFDDARQPDGCRRWADDRLLYARKLNEGSEGNGSGWGDLGAEWDAAIVWNRVLAAAGVCRRARNASASIGDLIATYFRGYADVAATRGEAFLDLDRGLLVMSQHARRLGYDAVVLFLDELILWLATRAGDVDFVSNEGIEAVEAGGGAEIGSADLPIVSFVARQRDLRELIGGHHHAGALEVRFLDIAQALGSALRQGAAGGPQPTGDRREAGC